eukprot:m.125804 g.125804  ORF g.125804 m.125804 type:complete len:100 (-) comp15626_c9_seq2:1825-2124(-)
MGSLHPVQEDLSDLDGKVDEQSVSSALPEIPPTQIFQKVLRVHNYDTNAIAQSLAGYHPEECQLYFANLKRLNYQFEQTQESLASRVAIICSKPELSDK